MQPLTACLRAVRVAVSHSRGVGHLAGASTSLMNVCPSHFRGADLSGLRAFSAAATPATQPPIEVDVRSVGAAGTRHTSRDITAPPASIHDQHAQFLKELAFHLPPRPDALHRIFMAVATPADLAVATRSLNAAIDRRVSLTQQTARMWVNACLRVDQPQPAIDALVDAASTRLFPSRSALHELAEYAAAKRDGALLKQVVKLFNTTGFNKSLTFLDGSSLIHAFCDVGDVTSALFMFQRLLKEHPEKSKTKAYPSGSILRVANANPAALTPEQRATISSVVLPVAAAFPRLSGMVQEFEAGSSASPAAEPVSAPAVETEAAPAATPA